MKLSVNIPAYNEETTISKVIDKDREGELPVEREIIVVDDGSTNHPETKLFCPIWNCFTNDNPQTIQTASESAKYLVKILRPIVSCPLWSECDISLKIN